jgi:RNA polymerase sigma-70 factor, ECF subfamily
MDATRLINANSSPFAPDDLQRLRLTAEQVYHAYGPRVYNMARKMVSNEKDAEDVTQDVFLQVVRKLPTFRGEAALPTWLHRVTVNAALAHRRKRALRQHGEPDSPFEELPGAGFTPEEVLIDEEQQRLLNEAIAGLSDTYRNVLVLSDLEGLSDAAIGARLGLSVPAVKSRLHRARLLLRDRLAPYFEELPV